MLVAADVPTWGLFVIGVVGVLGGLGGLYRWAKNAGAEESRQKEVELAVLGDGTAKNPSLRDQLAEVRSQMTPNGGHTRQLGDTVGRIEQNQKDLMSKLDRHIGASEQVHASLVERMTLVEEGRSA